MASVRQRKGSAMWYACITVETPEGKKQRQFSTGLTDRDEALAAAVAAERAARKHQEAPHQLRAALDKLAEDYTPAGDANPAEWLERWAVDVAPTVGAGTATAYADVAESAAAWLRQQGIKSFTQVTVKRMTDLRNFWRASGNNEVTCNTKLKRLSVALETAATDYKLLPKNPIREVARFKEKKTARREFRPAELKMLLATLTGEWRALVLLGYYTGQRLNDLAELRWFQLDLQAKTVIFHASKTDVLVNLPLAQVVVDALVELPAGENPQEFVFPKIAAMKRQTRSNHFRGLLASVGLHRPIVRKERLNGRASRQTAELTFHSLRHSLTSDLKSAGVGDSIAMAFVGHESAAVSRAYTHLDLETMRRALEKLPAL